MTQINFSPEFIETYEGTPAYLILLKNKLLDIVTDGVDFDNLATSITYNSNGFDKILTIKI